MKSIMTFLASLCFACTAYASEIKATQQNMDDIIAHSQKPVFVEFTETWCGPCKLAKPFIEELKKQNDFDIIVMENPSASFQKKHHVYGTPTFILYKQGHTYGRIVGYTKESSQFTIDFFRDWIKSGKIPEDTFDDLCACNCVATITTCDCPDMQKDKK